MIPQKSPYMTDANSSMTNILLLDWVICFAVNAERFFALRKVFFSPAFFQKKHQKGKDNLKKSKLKEETIIEAFKAEKSTAKVNTLRLEERAYRIEVISELLKAGIPIRKIDMLRPLLEKNGYRFTGSTNQGQYISIVLKQEIEQIKEALGLPGQVGLTRDLSINFDGSARQGEAIAIIVRFLDNNWLITQRLVRINVYSKSLTIA